MLKVLSYILCDLDPKVKVIGQKAGICDGVPSTSALVIFCSFILTGEKPRSVILDCSHVSGLDYTTIQGIIELVADFMRNDVNFALACVSVSYTSNQNIIELVADFMRNDVNFALACVSVS